MGEQLRTSVEHLSSPELHVEAEKNLERIREEAERAEQDPLQKHVDSLRQNVEQQAISGKEFNVGDARQEQSAQSFGITNEFKAEAYRKTIRRIQSNLSKPERAFSKVIHNRAVESTSNAVGSTVARPSAFLGGSFLALTGSVVLLYMTRQYGFTYNYAVIFILFVGGYVLGLLIELLVKTFVRKNR